MFKASSSGRGAGGGSKEAGDGGPAKDITELWEEVEKLVWECSDVCSSWHNQMSSLTEDGFLHEVCVFTAKHDALQADERFTSNEHNELP